MRFASQIVGIFVLTALGFIIFILVSMGINQRWFAKNYQYWSTFQTGEGLSIGMGIKFRGFQIGKVTNLELTDENDVRVDFYISDSYISKVHEGSVLQLNSNFLGSQLLFHQGLTPTPPPAEGSFIPSMKSEIGRKLIENQQVIIPNSEDTINNILSSVEPVLANVNNTLVSLNTVLASADDLLNGRNNGPVNEILVSVNGVVQNAEQAVSGLTDVIDDTVNRANTLLDSIQRIAGNIETTTEELRDPTGLIPKLLDPKGSLAKLLDDNDALFKQIEAILSGVNDSVGEVKEFAEFINTTSPQISGILEEGRAALDQGKDVLEGLRNNPLIRGGISEDLKQPTTFDSYRDTEF